MAKVLKQGSTPGLLEEIDVTVAASSNWFTSEYKLSEGRILPSGCFIHSPVPFETNGYLLDIENTGILAIEYNDPHNTLVDAPSDGNEYVRKDGNWVVKSPDTSWVQLELASDVFTLSSISLFEVPVISGQRLYFKFIGVIGESGGASEVSFSHTGTSGSIYMMYNNVNYEYLGDPLVFNIEEDKDLVIAEGMCSSSSTGNFRIGINVVSGSATVEKGCDLMYKVL